MIRWDLAYKTPRFSPSLCPNYCPNFPPPHSRLQKFSEITLCIEAVKIGKIAGWVEDWRRQSAQALVACLTKEIDRTMTELHPFSFPWMFSHSEEREKS